MTVGGSALVVECDGGRRAEAVYVLALEPDS